MFARLKTPLIRQFLEFVLKRHFLKINEKAPKRIAKSNCLLVLKLFERYFNALKQCQI